MSNHICMILDLEGFFIENTFRVRELGYYTWKEDFRRIAFHMPTRWSNLSDKDKKTVHYVSKHIHGLSYYLLNNEKGYPQEQVSDIVNDLHLSCKTENKTVVAYKGGHVQRDVLDTINNESFNLERWGCPKFDAVKDSVVELLPACHFHYPPFQCINPFHCPMTECHAFWLWMITHANKKTL